ncbi:hypothetical protein [Microvirga sp. TS319]|uniref:hypothetical protein n=1 Tax=Microvirga sp. TS319 TaxID=3241165 RepID=UPI00351A7478
MAIAADVMRIILMMDRAGLGELAGELYGVLAQGRIIGTSDGSTTELHAESSEQFPAPEQETDDTAYEDAEQIRVTIDFLRTRLVEPVKRLDEAEQIVALLTESKSPVGIYLVDTETGKDTELFSEAARKAAYRLDHLLDPLAQALLRAE